MRSHSSSPDDIDLAALGRAARRALPKIALLALATGGVTAGVMSTMAPRYTSQATVEIVARPLTNPNNVGATPTDTRDSSDREAVGTHVRKLLSTDLALRMNKELGLADMPEFNAALPAEDLFTSTLQTLGLVKARANETDDDRVLAAYYKAMKVAQVRETRNILIDFTTSDAQFSAKGANKLAEIYRDSLATTRKVDFSEAREKLKVQAERLEREVQTAENAVTAFRGQRDIFKGAQSAATLKEQQLGELTAELSKASAARTEADARAAAAKEQMARGAGESNLDVQKSQIIPRLSEQRIRLERQVSELSATLLPAHPRMRQLQNDLGSLQRQIRDEVKKVVDGMERDARTAADKETSLKRRIGDVKAGITVSAPDDAQLKNLEDTAKAKRAELERVQKSFLAAQSTEQTGDAPVEVRIVQRAFPMNEKVWPKPAFFGPLVMLATLLVGLAWSVTRAIVSGPRGDGGGGRGDRDTGRIKLDSVSSGREAALVAAPAQLAAGATGVARSPSAPIGTDVVAKSIADVAAVLSARATDSGPCRSLMTAETPTSDASGAAVALTKSIAAAGHSVALVEWANGGGRLAQLTGALAGPGLAQLIQGDAAFEDVIQKLADSDAQFISAGEALGDGSIVFDADRANLVLDALDEAYEHVVVFASNDDARQLFEATEGRFDVGVTVAQGRLGTATEGFLGFDVGDMDVHRVVTEQPGAGATPGPRRGPATRTPRPQAEARA